MCSFLWLAAHMLEIRMLLLLGVDIIDIDTIIDWLMDVFVSLFVGKSYL